MRETGQHIMIPDLVDMPLMLPRDSWFRNHLDDAFVAAGAQLHTVRNLETSAAMLAFALEGEGVTILPYSNIYAEIERNEVCCTRNLASTTEFCASAPIDRCHRDDRLIRLRRT